MRSGAKVTDVTLLPIARAGGPRVKPVGGISLPLVDSVEGFDEGQRLPCRAYDDPCCKGTIAC